MPWQRYEWHKDTTGPPLPYLSADERETIDVRAWHFGRKEQSRSRGLKWLCLAVLLLAGLVGWGLWALWGG